VSQACNDSFLNDGFLKTPHSVVSNPVDPERLVVRRTRAELLRTWGWNEPVCLLVAVARLAPQKGYPDLIEAMARLKSSGHSDLRLVVAGDGPLRSELEKLIGEKGLENEVRLLGLYQGVGDLYAAADGFVLPSLWEGLGLVVLEAWCLGCPVAASSLPALREFVVDGENGVLFAAGDPGAIADGIVRLLEDRDRARRWAARGRSLVLERFSPNRIAKQYSDLFRQILSLPTEP
jgi:glycosyltransferase involved in cell wall biosynthesis